MRCALDVSEAPTETAAFPVGASDFCPASRERGKCRTSGLTSVSSGMRSRSSQSSGFLASGSCAGTEGGRRSDVNGNKRSGATSQASQSAAGQKIRLGGALLALLALLEQQTSGPCFHLNGLRREDVVVLVEGTIVLGLVVDEHLQTGGWAPS